MSTARKPLRLRSACNECYAAKVRCSGEKDGCNRCLQNGFTCEYQVSMVGRASKKRQRPNDQIDLPQQSPAPFSNGITLPPLGLYNGPSSQPLLGACVLGDYTPTVNDTMADGPAFDINDFIVDPAEAETNRYLQNLLNEYPDLPLLSSGTTPFLSGAGSLLPDSHPDVNEISSSENISRAPGTHEAVLASPQIQAMPNQHISEAPPQQKSPELVRYRLAEQTDTRVPSVYRDQSVVSQYPHAAALMKTIEDLEEQLQTSQIPIDQAMLLNRQAMVKVRDVSNAEEFRRCQSCPLLVTAIMELVLGLYELVIVSIQQPSDQGNVSSPDQNAQMNLGAGGLPSDGSSPESAISTGSVPPLFHFGCLEFDPDEQEIFRTAMMRRDLRRCVETLQYCGQQMLPRQRQVANVRGGRINGGISQSTKPSNGPVHTQWYQEMGYRAKELLDALPAKCGH